MLKYLEFINENSNVHYDSFIIKIISRKTPEQAIEILKKDTLARSFRDEHSWEVIDPSNKLIKVYLKNPVNTDVLKKKVKGRHRDLKYVLSGLGDPITGIKATDKEKEQLKFLTNDRFIKDGDITPIFIGMYQLFNRDYSWSANYRAEWKEIVQEELIKAKDTYNRDITGLAPIVALNIDPHNEILVKKGFELILKAIDNDDLDIDPNWIKSLTSVKKFSLF